MNKTVTSLVLLLMLLPQMLMAQEKYMNQVKVEDVRVTRDGDHVIVGMNVNLDDLKIRSNDVILLSPALRISGTKEIVKMLPSMQVSGRTRSLVLDRMADTGIPRGWEVDPKMEFERKNGTRQSVSYVQRIPYESYMTDSELILLEAVHGCADCLVHEDAKVLLTPFLQDPVFVLSYVTPEVEPVKARKDRHSASLNFVVDRHEIVRSYKQNAGVLDQVDRVIREVKGNSDITITEFAVSGYASPEANFEYNRELAGRRANSFVDYLVSTHGILREQIKSVIGYGEDWKGLEEALRTSSLPNAKAVLDIIASTGNPDARDAKIIALDNGATYRTLLDRYYPALRRTDYVIAYNVRAFDVEEAKEVIKVNPKHLSLNEMYLVAKSYPADSKEFKEVFDIATRLYPDEPVAIINASAVDIEGGNYQAAIERLSKVSNSAAALNNMGVAYAKLGDRDRAIDCFNKAIAAGDMENAQNNLKQISK